MVYTNIKNLKLKIKNSSSGVSLIELIVAIFIIAIFSTILISDFPKMQRDFALSQAAYNLAQNIRRAQDLAFSGVQINDGESPANPIKTVSGYGVYFDVSSSHATKYVIYADLDNSKTYNAASPVYCSNESVSNPTSDCIVDTVDISQQNPNLYIKQPINNILGFVTSVNFSPPNPVVNISNLSSSNSVGIVLGLISDSSTTRTVWVNTSGLINVQ